MGWVRWMPVGLRGSEAWMLPSDGQIGSVPDGQLIEGYLSGDIGRSEAAFAALVEAHGPMVWGVCRNILGDQFAAEDAFQATFLILVRRAASIRRRDALGPWLYGVARRVAVRAKGDVARRQLRERQRPEMTARSDPGPIRPEEFDTLHEEIARLSERYRKPLILCYLEGRTHAEAARLLGCPVGTISIRLARARDRLRSRLSRRGVSIPAAMASLTLGHSESVSAMPGHVADSTIDVVRQLNGGMPMTAGVVSDSVAHLVRGEMGRMVLHGMAWIAASLLVAGSTVVGIARLAAPRAQLAQATVALSEADKVRLMDHLKLIGLAMLNYAAEHGGTFPAAAVRKDGQDLLSWRVALLPYLNERALYNQFHLDEPWDGPHNAVLIDRMPEVYAAVSPGAEPTRTTFYQVFVGPGSLFGEAGGTQLRSITDGMDRTFLVVEGAKPVPWSKPQEIPFDGKEPSPKSLGSSVEGFCAGLADGSVRFLRRDVAPKVLKALITPGGREGIATDRF